jgi:hypothetical protein
MTHTGAAPAAAACCRRPFPLCLALHGPFSPPVVARLASVGLGLPRLASVDLASLHFGLETPAKRATREPCASAAQCRPLYKPRFAREKGSNRHAPSIARTNAHRHAPMHTTAPMHTRLSLHQCTQVMVLHEALPRPHQYTRSPPEWLCV